MSDLALGTLISVKRHLLPGTLTSGTTYDTLLTEIAKGVAGAFDKHCNRLFARVASGTYECSADRDHVYVPRYPLESVSITALRTDYDTGWETQTSVIINLDETTGLVVFSTALGTYQDRLRLTYTGGYWYDTAETEDTALPSGATLLPANIKLAWLLQCKHVWDSKDALGLGTVEKPGVQSALAKLELAPSVKEMLRPYIRYVMV